MDLRRFTPYAPTIVRWGVGLVFLIFGVWQWIAPVTWYGYLPPTLPFGLGQATAIGLNGTIDVVFGLLLVLGLFTRVAALIAAVHLAIITSTLGWNDVMVRDIGLCIVLLGVFAHGEDALCVDSKITFKKKPVVKLLYIFEG